MIYKNECANCGAEIDVEEGDFIIDTKTGLYFCCDDCRDEYDFKTEPDDDYDEAEEELDDFVSIHDMNEDGEEWLRYNDNITTDGEENILNEIDVFKEQYPDHKILIKEHENEIGIVVQIWDDDRKVKEEIFFYDDIN